MNHNKKPKCSYKTEERLYLKQQMHITWVFSHRQKFTYSKKENQYLSFRDATYTHRSNRHQQMEQMMITSADHRRSDSSRHSEWPPQQTFLLSLPQKGKELFQIYYGLWNSAVKSTCNKWHYGYCFFKESYQLGNLCLRVKINQRE